MYDAKKRVLSSINNAARRKHNQHSLLADYKRYPSLFFGAPRHVWLSGISIAAGVDSHPFPVLRMFVE